MATLPKYTRGDLDYSGLPSWLFNSTPINFYEEVLNEKKRDEAAAQLDQAKGVREDIKASTVNSSEDLANLLRDVGVKYGDMETLTRGERLRASLDDNFRGDGYQEIQLANTLRALGATPEMVAARAPGLFSGINEQQLNEMNERFMRPKTPSAKSPAQPKPEKLDVQADVVIDPESGRTARQFISRSEFNRLASQGLASLVEKVANKDKKSSMLDEIESGPPAIKLRARGSNGR